MLSLTSACFHPRGLGALTLKPFSAVEQGVHHQALALEAGSSRVAAQDDTAESNWIQGEFSPEEQCYLNWSTASPLG